MAAEHSFSDIEAVVQGTQSKWKDSYLNDDDSELSLRTFHGHKDAIEELFPVKIECDVADGYRYYVVKTSPKEQDSMLEWMLNSFNIADIVGDAKNMHDRILLEEIPGGTEYLKDIISALKDNNEHHLIYQSYKHPEPYDCHFQPYAMKVVRQRWYILGYLIESNGIRTIALDRIQFLETTKKKFTVPKDFSAKDYFMNSVGIWVNEEDKPQRSSSALLQLWLTTCAHFLYIGRRKRLRQLTSMLTSSINSTSTTS